MSTRSVPRLRMSARSPAWMNGGVDELFWSSDSEQPVVAHSATPTASASAVHDDNLLFDGRPMLPSSPRGYNKDHEPVSRGKQEARAAGLKPWVKRTKRS